MLPRLCAAVEFGVQPLWFHDAAGAPLYAPYPLHISIPAMMIGHLTIAGFAELVITAGMVSYLQSADVDLLRRTAPHAALDSVPATNRPLRSFWIAICSLILLTPLGVLAAGKAWGEWKPEELRSTPKGLLELSNLWRAPLGEYAPAFIPNAAAGYLLSAGFGVVLILLVVWGGRWLLGPHTAKARRLY